jgi:hypothetical protein
MQTEEKRFRKVSVGIGLMIASVVVFALYVFSFLLLPLSASIGSADFSRAVIMFLSRFLWPIMLTSTLLGIAGPSMCLASPREVKGTGYLLVSMLFSVLGLTVDVIGMLAILPGWLTIATYLLPFGSSVFFILFVGRLAIYLDKYDIRKLAFGTLMLAGVAAILGAVQWAFLVKLDSDFASNAMVVLLVLPVAIQVFVVLAYLRYLRLLGYARRATLARSKPISRSADMRENEVLGELTS